MAPFLTDIDSRAAVKGSRDPLAIQPIWTKLGRNLIGNLTMASNSLRDFTTMLLGYYFAEQLSNSEIGEGDLATFIKWEQLAVYARGGINGDWTFRGTERANKNWNEGKGEIQLGANPKLQILSNQKIYGLWGLYSVPARSSGLVEGDPTRLTNAGRELVTKVYLPIFTAAGFPDGKAIAKILAEKQPLLKVDGRDQKLFQAVANLFGKKLHSYERDILTKHLLSGGPQDETKGLQTILSELLTDSLVDATWSGLSPSRMLQLAKEARTKGELGERTAERLERIRTCELIMAPSAYLFGYLLGNHDQTIPQVANGVRELWGERLSWIDPKASADLEAELGDASGDKETGTRWIRIADALSRGEYEETITLLLEQNHAVMARRSGSGPWIDLREEKLQVRFQDERPTPLPNRDELPEYWRHPYFLDSLREIARALKV
jgi:hypothetical protein